MPLFPGSFRHTPTCYDLALEMNTTALKVSWAWAGMIPMTESCPCMHPLVLPIGNESCNNCGTVGCTEYQQVAEGEKCQANMTHQLRTDHQVVDEAGPGDAQHVRLLASQEQCL